MGLIRVILGERLALLGAKWRSSERKSRNTPLFRFACLEYHIFDMLAASSPLKMVVDVLVVLPDTWTADW